MAANSNIEWTHATFNPWRGCTKVSEGCKNCYAETLSARNPAVLGTWGPKGERVIAAESYWKQPLAWNKAAQAEGVRRRVFCASLADVFEGKETMPAASWEAVQKARLRLLALISQTHWLNWLLLTKRPENILPMLRELQALCRTADAFSYLPPLQSNAWACSTDALITAWLDGIPPANVWLGTSVENQETADVRIPYLLAVPAVVRFLSMEPLLGPVDLSRAMPCGYYCDESIGHIDHPFVMFQGQCNGGGIHWVITGGESGPHARPSHPDWFRSLRDQCQAAGVPFHFKQWGEWIDAGQADYSVRSALMMAPRPDSHSHHFDGFGYVYRVGKKNASRLLDGRTWDEFPMTNTEEAR